MAAGLVPGAPPAETPEEPPNGLEHLGTTPDVATLAASVFKQDTAEANGSSIVLLLEHDGASMLLTGDAFPSVVLDGVNRLLAERDAGPGSRSTPSRCRTTEAARTSPPRSPPRSTATGTSSPPTARTRSTRTPRRSPARSSARGRARRSTSTTRPSFTEPWADDELEEQHGYEAVYPDEGETGLTLELGDD